MLHFCASVLMVWDDMSKHVCSNFIRTASNIQTGVQDQFKRFTIVRSRKQKRKPCKKKKKPQMNVGEPQSAITVLQKV